MQSPYLSDRQLSELNESVVQYLATRVFTGKSDQSTKNSPGNSDSPDNPTTPTPPDPALLEILARRLTGKTYRDFAAKSAHTLPHDLLEKKWATVLSLQKRIFELEQDLESQRKVVREYDALLAGSDGSDGNSGAINGMRKNKCQWLPGAVRATLRYHNGSVTALAIHPYKPLLATAGRDGTIAVWNLLDAAEPEKIIRHAHSRTINALCFQGATTVSGSSTGKTQNPTGNGMSNSVPRTKSHHVLLASAASDMLVKLWDLAGKNYRVPVRSLAGHEHAVSGAVFSRTDPTHLVTCSRDTTIKVWDTTTGWCVRTIRGHSDWVRGVDLAGGHQSTPGDSGPEEFILSCSNDQSVRLTHLDSGKGIGLCIGHEQVVEDAIFLPYSAPLDPADDSSDLDNKLYRRLGYKYCASCGRDNLIKIWRLPLPTMVSGTPGTSANPRAKLLYEIRGHSTWVRRLAVHPSGNYLASCSDDGTIKVWDLREIGRAISASVGETGDGSVVSPVRTLKAHDGFVNIIRFAAPVVPAEFFVLRDSEKATERRRAQRILEQGMRCYLVSGSVDATAKVWV